MENFKEMGIPDYLACLLKTCMQVKKEQLEIDMKQRTASKLGKEYIKAVYCHPPYLTYMQNTSCKIPGWMNHKLESRLPGEISITSDMQMTPPLWQKVRAVDLGQSTVARESNSATFLHVSITYGHRCRSTLSRGPQR